MYDTIPSERLDVHYVGHKYAPSMGIELAATGQAVVTLANWAMANIGNKRKIAVYIRH